MECEQASFHLLESDTFLSSSLNLASSNPMRSNGIPALLWGEIIKTNTQHFFYFKCDILNFNINNFFYLNYDITDDSMSDSCLKILIKYH